MAITQESLGFASGSKLYVDTNSGVTAQAVSASAATIYAIEVDNTANASPSYLKLWNTGTVVVGTTAPDKVELVAASTKLSLVYPDGAVYGTALSVATLTTGGTAGTSAPASAVTVRIVYTS